MSKITFRADDDLVRELEEFDASKSEVMREALRAYLGEDAGDAGGVHAGATAGEESLDDLVADRVDDIIADRLEGAFTAGEPRDVNVNITLDGDPVGASRGAPARRKTDRAEATEPAEGEDDACKQCGEELPADAVYCSNCGSKSSHRLFCECGDELRSDWAFCPGCGRRTPAADVLRDG